MPDEGRAFICDPRNIAAAFVDRTIADPERLALVDHWTTMSYGETLDAVRTLAQLIAGFSGKTVAIIAERSVDTPIAAIACLLVGCPFVLIDSAYPVRRILDMIDITDAAAIIHSPGNLIVERDDFRLDAGNIPQFAMTFEPGESLVCANHEPGETAYILFTSGSTGLPKGIRTGHAPLIHFIEWYRQTFKPTVGSRFSMLSGLSHDPVLRDIFVPLSTGGTIHIPRKETFLVPDAFFAWMKSSRVEFAHVTPQFIDLLVARKSEATLDYLRHVFCGGDILKLATVEGIRSLSPSARIVNFYGTSETPQAMLYHLVGDEAPPYPLGKPIADVKIQILDADHRPVDRGIRGEIGIQTAFLSQGYVRHSPGETLTRLNGFLELPGGRTYLTGDTGYIGDQGEVYFVGRSDDQVKVRGYRVDCAEIAHGIERAGLARRAVVIPGEDERQHVFLAAFLVGSEVGDVQTLRVRLAKILPPQMMPDIILSISAFPLLPNGKINRATLLERAQDEIATRTVSQSDPDDPFLAQVRAQMGVARFDASHSFQDSGGDSLSYVNVSIVIEDHLGYLPENWANLRFDHLAELVAAQGVDGPVDHSRFMTIELSVLLRTISIVLVVMNHAGIFIWGHSFDIEGTPTLFVVSGLSYSRFILPKIAETGDVRGVFRFIWKFALPAGLYEAGRGIKYRPLWLPDLFLLGTMWARPYAGPKRVPRWYLDILTANILIFTVICLLFRKHLSKNRDEATMFRFSMAVGVFGVAAMIFQHESGIWDGIVSETSVGPFRWFWLFALGACVHFAKSARNKVIVSALIVAVSIFYGQIIANDTFKYSFLSFVIPSLLLLTWVDRVTIPRMLNKPILLIASHTLFIYIVGTWFLLEIVPRLGLEQAKLAGVTLTILFGIGVSIAWNATYGFAARFLSQTVRARQLLRPACPDLHVASGKR